MNVQEAIHFAECLKHNWTIDFNDMEDFCDMAIKALKHEESTITLGDLIGRIIPGHSELVEIRDTDNYEICTTRSDRKGITPYLDCELIGWFPFNFTSSGGICVLIKEE